MLTEAESMTCKFINNSTITKEERFELHVKLDHLGVGWNQIGSAQTRQKGADKAVYLLLWFLLKADFFFFSCIPGQSYFCCLPGDSLEMKELE